METLGERIRHVRENMLSLNQSGLANKLGFSRVATISDYETNKRLPDITSLRKLASFAGVSLQWLLTGDGPVYLVEGNSQRTFRVISARDEAGDFAEVHVYGKDYREGASPIDRIFIPEKDFEWAPFALRVEGHAMSPTIIDGATVGVDRGSRQLASGQLYAIWHAGEGITVRRVFICEDNVVLRPDNPAFPETTFHSTEVSDRLIAGRVLWLYQRYD